MSGAGVIGLWLSRGTEGMVQVRFFDRFRRTSPADDRPRMISLEAQLPEGRPPGAGPGARSNTDDGDGGPERWYVPSGPEHRDRFATSDGVPPLRLIEYWSSETDEWVLRLCENSTGLLVGPTDRRLPALGVYVSNLRGERYHQDECRAGDFGLGAPVLLVREPENEHDKNAVAVYDATGQHLAAYMNKQRARQVAKLLDRGEPLVAISLRGTPAGMECPKISILVTAPDLIHHLLSPRPRDAAPLVPPPRVFRG